MYTIYWHQRNSCPLETSGKKYVADPDTRWLALGFAARKKKKRKRKNKQNHRKYIYYGWGMFSSVFTFFFFLATQLTLMPSWVKLYKKYGLHVVLTQQTFAVFSEEKIANTLEGTGSNGTTLKYKVCISQLLIWVSISFCGRRKSAAKRINWGMGFLGNIS